MNQERGQRIQTVFEAALRCESAGRASLLDALCGDDPELRAEVERLLSDDERASRERFLADPTPQGRSDDHDRPALHRLLGLDIHIRCPHCRNPIELVGLPAGDVVCPSCGSSFHLERESTAPWSPRRGERKVGRFELIDTVGVGAFGTVYKAHDPQLDRVVALKVPRAGSLSTDDDRARFVREARNAAQLRHPAIVPVHEVGEHDDMPFIVSGFVQGVTLADRLTAGKPTHRDSARIVAGLADALQFAHDRGVIHRDVKPSNVMLDDQGLPHLMDFGLAKRDAGEITMTLEGQVLGTPAYMSPEQARGEAHRVDGRSDVYSLGVILYELSTGELPFRGNSRILLHQVLHDEPTPPRRLDDSIARDLETICLKAMAKDLNRRYATARELGEDLRRFLSGEAIQARQAGRIDKAWRWCRRNPPLAVASSLALIALMAVSVIATVYAIQQSQAAKTERTLRSDVTEGFIQAKSERDKADQERNKVQQLASDMALEQGRSLSEQGDVPLGLLFIARALELVPSDNAAFQQNIRANVAIWRREIASLREILAFTERYINRVAFSPDGKTILIGGETARLWSTSDGTPIGQPMSHRGNPVIAVAFSPDGKTILIGTVDGTVRLWSAADGTPIGPPILRGGFLATTAIAFSPDGKAVLTASFNGTAQLWSAANGASLIGKTFSRQSPGPAGSGPPGSVPGWLAHHEAIYTVAFSPDGKAVLTASGSTARLWSAADGTPIGPAMTHQATVNAVAFSPDGKAVLTASGSTARLWSAADGTPIGPAMTHQATVKAVAFSPDGKALLTGSTVGNIQLWGADGESFGKPISQQSVSAVAFSPDGKTILTGDRQTARLWSAADRMTYRKTMTHQATVNAVAFSPDGKAILTASGSTARLWSAADGTPIGPAMTHQATVDVVAFSPDGKAVLTADTDSKARHWSAADGTLIGQPMSYPGKVIRMAFSPDGTAVLTGNLYGTARLWSAADGTPIVPPMSHRDAVNTINYDGTAVLTAMAFSRDGKTILTGDYQTARLWSAVDGTPIGQRISPQFGITAMAFSPDGKVILISGGSTARLWSATDGTPIGPAMTHQDTVHAMAFSPDGKAVLTVSGSTARLWSAADSIPIGPAMTHQDTVHAVAFSPDGKAVLTASGSTARLWQVPLAVDGNPRRITAWVQVITGMELEISGEVRFLNRDTWQERRRLLDELGGPPMP